MAEAQRGAMDRAGFLQETAAVSAVAAVTGGLAAASGVQPSLAAEVMGTSYQGEHQIKTCTKLQIAEIADFVTCFVHSPPRPLLCGISNQFELFFHNTCRIYFKAEGHVALQSAARKSYQLLPGRRKPLCTGWQLRVPATPCSLCHAFFRRQSTMCPSQRCDMSPGLRVPLISPVFARSFRYSNRICRLCGFARTIWMSHPSELSSSGASKGQAWGCVCCGRLQ